MNDKNDKITKDTIIQHLKSEVGMADNEAKKLLKCFFESLQEEVMSGSNVKFYEFGTFSKKTSAKKLGRDFKTGELIEILPKEKIKFKKSTKKA